MNLVGEGPEYDEIREAARKLLPLFVDDKRQWSGRWGAGLVDVQPLEGGHEVSILHPILGRWKQVNNSLRTNADLGLLRATGIALLAYCEEQERRGA